MRELMIRFVDDGEIFNEIDEKRNYYLSEAEVIVNKIRIRLANEKRVASPKEFECWIDGDRLIITSVRFENEESLENQLKETILNYDGWEEGTKHKYVNKINEYGARERELMVNREFKAFVIRLDQYMGNQKVEPFPLLLKIEKAKTLFDGISTSISTGFYSELEEVMGAINEAFQIVVKLIHEDMLSNEKDISDSLMDLLKDRIISWLGNDNNFNRFKNYVIACYGSVTKSRIRALYPIYQAYQDLQIFLFKDYAKKHGFHNAYTLNNDLHQSFFDKFDHILFEGFAIKSDDMVQSLILSPVVKTFYEMAQNKYIEEPRMDSESHDEGMVEDEK